MAKCENCDSVHWQRQQSSVQVREPETGVEKVKRKWLQRTGPQVDILVIAPKTVGERIKEGLSKTFPIDKWEVNLDECDRIERARVRALRGAP